MEWFRSPSLAEGLMALVFVLALGGFLLLTWRRGRALFLSPAKGVWAKAVWRALYFALFLVALLGPSFGAIQKEIQAKGKDIFLCVDLSQSMNATDIAPSRLGKVKYELQNVMEAFQGDRLGIVIFSNSAFMQCPLTDDGGALALFLEALNTDLVPNAGTNFGPPLEMALEKHLDPENLTNRKKSKIIVLVSDGEDFGDRTDEIARRIEDEGIKLFALGVGTKSGSKIPLEKGRYKTNDQGEAVITKLNSSDLKNLANRSGGQYFLINRQQNQTQALINAIKGIEGEVRDTMKLDVSANKYQYFLIPALIMMALDMLLVIRVFQLS